MKFVLKKTKLVLNFSSVRDFTQDFIVIAETYFEEMHRLCFFKPDLV